MNLLLDHEKEYIKPRRGKSFVPDESSVLKIGMLHESSVREKFVWGGYDAAARAMKNRNFLVDPIITPIRGNERYRLVWT